MTATIDRLLTELRTRHVRIEVAGDRVRLIPRKAIDDTLAAELKANKSDLLEALRTPQTPQELPEPWGELWHERAAIMHFDGCLPLPEAERLAFDDVLRLMRAETTPISTSPPRGNDTNGGVRGDRNGGARHE